MKIIKKLFLKIKLLKKKIIFKFEKKIEKKMKNTI